MYLGSSQNHVISAVLMNEENQDDDFKEYKLRADRTFSYIMF